MSDSTTAATGAPSFKPMGAPGLNVLGGRISDEYDKRLRGDRAIKTYREMVDDPVIHAVLLAFESMVRSVGYRIEAAKVPDELKAAAELEAERTRDDIEGMDGAWSDTLSEILSALAYGFSLFEIIYRREPDGRISWERWAPRAQDTIIEWKWNEETWVVTHAVQSAPPHYRRVELPIGRCIHFRVRPRKQNPMGTSLLRPCYDPWYYQKHIQKIEAIGIERDLTGIPVISIPSDTPEAERKDWESIGASVNANEAAYIVLGSDVHSGTSVPKYKFDLMNSGGERSIDTDKVLARYERKIFRAFLGGFLTLGDQGVGSFALGTSLADFFIMAAKAILEGFQDTINVTALRVKAALNQTPEQLVPKFLFNEVERRDIKAFAETLAFLFQAGLIDPEDKQLRRVVMEILGLPAPQDEEPAALAAKTASPPVPVPAPNTAPDLSIGTPVVAADSQKFAEAEISDDLLERARKAWDDVAEPKYQGMLDAEVIGEDNEV